MSVSVIAAIFASPSLCIKLNGYDFNNIVATKIYSLDHSTNCDNKVRLSETTEKSILIYAEIQPETKLKFCISEAAYTVSALKESNVYDNMTISIISQKMQDCLNQYTP